MLQPQIIGSPRSTAYDSKNIKSQTSGCSDLGGFICSKTPVLEILEPRCPRSPLFQGAGTRFGAAVSDRGWLEDHWVLPRLKTHAQLYSGASTCCRIGSFANSTRCDSIASNRDWLFHRHDCYYYFYFDVPYCFLVVTQPRRPKNTHKIQTRRHRCRCWEWRWPRNWRVTWDLGWFGWKFPDCKCNEWTAVVDIAAVG